MEKQPPMTSIQNLNLICFLTAVPPTRSYQANWYFRPLLFFHLLLPTPTNSTAAQINNEGFPPNTKPNPCKHASTRVTNVGIQKMECKGFACRKILPSEDEATWEGIPTLHLCRPRRTHIQAMSYTLDISIVDTVLEPMTTYIISNAKILPCNIQFRIVDHPFQWVLTTSTSMEPTLENPLSRSLAVPAFTPFSQLEQHKSSDTNLNVIAIVIDKSNPRTVNGMYGTFTIQGLVLITTEKLSILLSCWNDFITSEAAPIIEAAPSFPIIAGLHVRAQEFRGLSLTVRGVANLLLNPPYPNAEPLKAWRNTNKDFIATTVQEKQYFALPTSHKIIHHTEATSIATILNSPNSDHFTIKGQLSLPPEQQDYYYMSCPSCFHNTTANPGMHFTSRNCEKQNLPKLRARCTITMLDILTQMDIVAFGELAAKILGISVEELLNMAYHQLHFSNAPQQKMLIKVRLLNLPAQTKNILRKATSPIGVPTCNHFCNYEPIACNHSIKLFLI